MIIKDIDFITELTIEEKERVNGAGLFSAIKKAAKGVVNTVTTGAKCAYYKGITGECIYKTGKAAVKGAYETTKEVAKTVVT